MNKADPTNLSFLTNKKPSSKTTSFALNTNEPQKSFYNKQNPTPVKLNIHQKSKEMSDELYALLNLLH